MSYTSGPFKEGLGIFFSFEIDLIQHQSCIELLEEKKVFFNFMFCFHQPTCCVLVVIT